MNRLPDPEASRAVLIGTSRYNRLEPLPAVHNNILQLRKVLCDDTFWGLRRANCVVVENPTVTAQMLDPVVTAAAEATDTMLLYFAGHGLVGQATSDLRLALVGSDSDPQRSYTAVAYDEIRSVLKFTRAIRRVVILDCCFSGRALGQMADKVGAVVAGAEIEGTYLMAAAAENKTALAPPQEKFTAFTGELLDVIQRGIPGRGSLLDLDSIFNWVREAMREKSRPIPQIRGRNTAGQLNLVRNQAYGAKADSGVGVTDAAASPYKKDSILGPDLRLYVGVSRATTEYQLVITALETSLAYQGKRVALNREAYGDEMRKRAPLPPNEQGQYAYTRSDWVKVIEKIGIPSDPAGRLYSARVIPVHSGEDIVEQLREGRPVAAIATMREAWIDRKVQSTGRLPWKTGKVGNFIGFKMILILGWDPVERMFAMLTPWPEWGDRGNGWMPNVPNLFNEYISGADAIEGFEIIQEPG